MKVLLDEKLTIKLSKKAMDTLTALTESSGFGSKGRTIEEAILAIDDLTRFGDTVFPVLAQTAQKPPQEQAVFLLTSFNSMFAYFVATLARFRKPTRPQAPVVAPPVSVSPPVANATSSGGRQLG